MWLLNQKNTRVKNANMATFRRLPCYRQRNGESSSCLELCALQHIRSCLKRPAVELKRTKDYVHARETCPVVLSTIGHLLLTYTNNFWCKCHRIFVEHKCQFEFNMNYFTEIFCNVLVAKIVRRNFLNSRSYVVQKSMSRLLLFSDIWILPQLSPSSQLRP